MDEYHPGRRDPYGELTQRQDFSKVKITTGRSGPCSHEMAGLELGAMQSEEIRKNYIEEFLASLSPDSEQRWFPNPNERVKLSSFLAFAILDGEIAGMGGLIVSYGLYPYCWVVVKSRYQGKGIGKAIIRNVMGHARGRYSFVTLNVNKENQRAVSLYHQVGYRTYYENDRVAWMGIGFNQWGRAVLKCLRVGERVYELVYRSFLRSLLVWMRDWKFRRGMTRQEVAYIHIEETSENRQCFRGQEGHD